MSDQNLVKKHLELLRNAQNINKEHKCLEALDILENHFDGTLSSPEISKCKFIPLQQPTVAFFFYGDFLISQTMLYS